MGTGKPTYSLIAEVMISLSTQNLWGCSLKKNEKIEIQNATCSDEEFSLSRDIYLCSEKEGKLKELFEEEWEFLWEIVADEYECSYSEMLDWCNRLETATNKGALIWEIHCGKDFTRYSTKYDFSEVDIYIATDQPDDYNQVVYGDSIYIKEKENRVFHFGKRREDRIPKTFNFDYSNFAACLE